MVSFAHSSTSQEFQASNIYPEKLTVKTLPRLCWSCGLLVVLSCGVLVIAQEGTPKTSKATKSTKSTKTEKSSTGRKSTTGGKTEVRTVIQLPADFEKLDLQDEQKTKIQEIQSKYVAQIQKLLAQSLADCETTLTPAQMQTLKELRAAAEKRKAELAIDRTKVPVRREPTTKKAE